MERGSSLLCSKEPLLIHVLSLIKPVIIIIPYFIKVQILYCTFYV
jgi:hypothetical protein